MEFKSPTVGRSATAKKRRNIRIGRSGVRIPAGVKHYPFFLKKFTSSMGFTQWRLGFFPRRERRKF